MNLAKPLTTSYYHYLYYSNCFIRHIYFVKVFFCEIFHLNTKSITKTIKHFYSILYSVLLGHHLKKQIHLTVFNNCGRENSLNINRTSNPFGNICRKGTILILVTFFIIYPLFIFTIPLLLDNEERNSSKVIDSSFCIKYKLYFNQLDSCANDDIDQGRFYTQKNIDTIHCTFSMIKIFSGNGGVIFVNGGSLNMNISNSMFYNCSCSLNGGAIYFISLNSILRMICAFRCSSFSYHFAYLSVTQNSHIEYLSLSYCSYETEGSNSIRLYKGNQRFDTSNSSSNSSRERSCIRTGNPTIFLSKYCSFVHNNVSEKICIYFEHNTGEISFAIGMSSGGLNPMLGDCFNSIWGTKF